MSNPLHAAMDSYNAKRLYDESLPCYCLEEVEANQQSELSKFFASLRSHATSNLEAVSVSARGENVLITVDIVVTAMLVVQVPDEELSTTEELVYNKRPDWIVHGEVAVWESGTIQALTNDNRVWCLLETNTDSDLVTDGNLQFLDRQPGGYTGVTG